jgi:branched-chain amino acid transport system permease protein
MTTQTPVKPTHRAAVPLWKNPVAVGIFLVVYVIVIAIILLSLDRRDTWFPLKTTLAFPPLALAPLLIINSPLSRFAKAIGLFLLLGIVLPFVGIYDTNYLELLIQISIFSALALGLNIVVGFAGLLDLGYVAFFAVGAYLWGMFTSSADNMLVPGSGLITLPVIHLQVAAFPLFLVIGIVVAAIFGIVLGLPVLRLRGDYLAIVTLGFGEVIRVLVNNLDKPINLTNGAQGLHNVAAPSSAFLLRPLDLAFQFLGSIVKTNSSVTAESVQQQILLYFIAITLVGIIMVLANRLDNSPIGRAWTAIREDEVAAIAMGVPLVRMKLLAFATGAACAGAVGVLYGAKQTFVSPESFQLTQSINILAMVIVGGLGGIRGVLLGATVVTLLNLQVLTNFALQINSLRNIDYVVPIINFPIKNWPTQLTPDKYQRFVFGILLILMMIFRPAGLLPEPRRAMELEHTEAELPKLKEVEDAA